MAVRLIGEEQEKEKRDGIFSLSEYRERAGVSVGRNRRRIEDTLIHAGCGVERRPVVLTRRSRFRIGGGPEGGGHSERRDAESRRGTAEKAKTK